MAYFHRFFSLPPCNRGIQYLDQYRILLEDKESKTDFQWKSQSILITHIDEFFQS